MNSHASNSGQQSHVPHPPGRQNSWFGFTLDQLKNQLGKPLGAMNLDELLKNVWTAEGSQSSVLDRNNTSPAASLQRQASLSLANALNGKTVDDVWRDISNRERELTLGEITLEDFLVKAGMYMADSSNGNASNSQNVLSEIGLSSSPSIDALSDSTVPGRKRESSGLEKTIERRLRRKIKNRESAARSRARKQAYHGELVGKVSLLEEENLKLKKEKEFEKITSRDLSEPRYQLRRTCSF